MHFCGLDVSLRQTAVCIVDDGGKIVKEAKIGFGSGRDRGVLE